MEDNMIKSENIEIDKTIKCLNCGTEFHGKFCPECGQRADTGRFTIKFMLENLLRGIVSNDGGVWITLKTLFTRPGQMMIDIINGKHRAFFSPFPMLFLVLSIYVIISTFTGSYVKMSSAFSDENETVVVSVDNNPKNVASQKILSIFKKIVDFADDHYSFVYILTIPIYLFSARICFGKANRRRYTWGEYCIPMIYSLILVVIYRCLSAIVYSFSNTFSDEMDTYTFFINIITFTVCFRKMLDFSVMKMIWRSFLLMILYWTIIVVLVIGGIVLLAIFYQIFNGL